MQILIPAVIAKRLARDLKRGGSREIGGVLMGEHLGADVFRVVEFSVQHRGGSEVCFIRDPRVHESQLKRFFVRTGANYTQFNYLGEWHSHPCFTPTPSSTDAETMQGLVEDPSAGSSFLVLLIAKLDTLRHLEISVTAFRPSHAPVLAQVTLEADSTASGAAEHPVRRILRRQCRRGSRRILKDA